jgi:hypothetical protein
MVSVNRWRMMLTASALRHGGTWVSEVGFSVGYTSEPFAELLAKLNEFEAVPNPSGITLRGLASKR